MATLDDRTYSAVFSGLKSTAITAGIFFVSGCTLHEIFKRLRRYPDEDKARKRGENVTDRGMEGWAMGYLYRARTYVEGERAPDFANYPLSWMWEAIRRKASYFEEHDVGADAVVYLRFLRGTREPSFHYIEIQGQTGKLTISINLQSTGLCSCSVPSSLPSSPSTSSTVLAISRQTRSIVHQSPLSFYLVKESGCKSHLPIFFAPLTDHTVYTVSEYTSHVFGSFQSVGSARYSGSEGALYEFDKTNYEDFSETTTDNITNQRKTRIDFLLARSTPRSHRKIWVGGIEPFSFETFLQLSERNKPSATTSNITSETLLPSAPIRPLLRLQRTKTVTR